MKTQIKKAITALALAVGFTTAATAATPRTISINFDSGSGSVSGEYGIVPSSSWNNFTGAKQTSSKAVTVSDGTTGVTAMWWSANTYSWGSVTDNALKGYLDDGACGDGKTSNGPHIGIFGIPFASYDVILYYATDTDGVGFNPAALSEWVNQTTCGSQAYSYDGSFMAARNDSSLKFGQSRQKTAIIGKNVSYLKKGFTWTNLDIKGGANVNSARGGIAAIQIVEVVETTEYTATVSADTLWSAIEWDKEVPAEGFAYGDQLTLNVTGSPTITFDEIVNVSATLTINGSVLLKADDKFFTNGCYEKKIGNFGTFTAADATVPTTIPAGFVGAYTLTEKGFKVRAQNREVISINIAGGSITPQGTFEPEPSPTENMVPENDEYYGIAPTPGRTWNNIDKKWKNTRQTVTLKGSKAAAVDGTVADRPTIDLSATASTTWQANISNPFLRGYLDDGGGVEVAVHGVPYTSYDVIVYATSDDASIVLAPITINGTKYTFADGETKAGSTAWGAGLYATPEIGKNALRVDGCTGDTLTISAARDGGRGTICAVQVICQGEVLLKDEFTATISESTAFGNIDTWNKTFAEGQLHEATVNVGEGEGEVELTFDNPDLLLAKLIVNSERDIKFTATKPLNNVSQFIVTGCTAKVTYNYPVDSLQMTTDGLIAYAGGAGSETKTAGIGFVTDGDLTLTGGDSVAPYYIGDTFQENTNPYTMTFTDATVYCKGWAGLAIGTATVTIDGSTTVNAEKFILSQGTAGQVSDITIKDTSAVNITGTTDVDSNQSSIMFGHWDGPSTFTLQDTATFTAASQVLVGKTGNTQTINLDGGTFMAKGIKVSSGGTEFDYTLNLNGGSLMLGEVGLSSYSNQRFITVNVTADSTIASTAAMPITQPIVIDADKTLTLDATDGDIVVSGAVTGEGSIKVIGGNVTFMESTGVTNDKVTVESGKAFYGLTVTLNHLGRFELTSGLTADNVKLFDQGGQPVEFTDRGTYLEFEWNYKGSAAWWDYEFEGDLSNAGSDGTALTNEGSDYWNTASNAIIVGKGTPYRGADWTSEEGISCVMYGKMVAANNTIQIGFGNVSKCVMLATGDTSKEEVILYATPNGSGVAATKLCTMSVPNAQSAKHLYAFVMRTVDSKTVMDIYLDGKLLQPYDFGEEFTLANGFQIGSVHGGVQSTGVLKSTAAETTSELDVLLVYKTALSAAAIQKLADEEYPYVSKNGKATRTVGAADTTWVETDKWQQAQFEAETLTTDAPNAKTMVEVTVEEDATLALNLTEQANYEALEFKGAGALTLTGAADAVVPNVSGATTIGTDVTVAYDAVKFGNITIADGKTLTFDFASLDLSKEWANRSIKLTGVATLGEGSSVGAMKVPTAIGRTATLTYSDATKQYSLEIALNGPLTATLAAGVTTKLSELVWKIGEAAVEPDWTVVTAADLDVGEGATLDVDTSIEGVTLTASDDLTVIGLGTVTVAPAAEKLISVYVADDAETTELPCTIVGTVGKNGPGTLTLAMNREFLVKEGTLKAANAQNLTSTVTIDENATFDFNGAADGYVTIVMNGGELVNNGTEIGTGNRQMNGLTLNADATVGGTGGFGLISSGYGANTLALGENTLTKTGENTFWLCNTTITGTGTIDVQEGALRVVNNNATFADGTITGTGSIKIDKNLTLTVGTIDGVTIENGNNGAGSLVANTLGNVTFAGAVSASVTTCAYYAGIATNVTLAAQAAVYFPAGVTHARKDFAEKLTREGAIFVDAAEGAQFAGTFVFPKANVAFTEAFTTAIKAAGYVRRETATEVVYFRPSVVIIR